jgi:hypothetical protein
VDKFKAMLKVENPAALFVQNLIESVGRKPGMASNGLTVSCLSSMLAIYNRGHKAALSYVWPLIAAVCEGQSIHKHMLEAMVYLTRHMDEHGEDLLDPKWVQRLYKVGPNNLLDAMHRAAGLHGRGSPPVHAQGIIVELNKSMRYRAPSVDLGDTHYKRSVTQHKADAAQNDEED